VLQADNCDEFLLNQVFCEGNLKIEISERFFGGDLMKIEEGEPPMLQEEPPMLQPDGFYKVHVSSLKNIRRFTVVTWQGKEIRLRKSSVKQSQEKGDKIYIIISPELYNSKFVEEEDTNLYKLFIHCREASAGNRA